MTKASQDNNLNSINFLKHFYEYLTEKLKYRGVTPNLDFLFTSMVPWSKIVKNIIIT